MNDSDSKEFQEWYTLMKERANQILKDSTLTNEQKQIFIERSTEPLGTWKLSKIKNVKGNQDTKQAPVNGKQPNDGSLERTMEKYKLVKDEKGLKVSSFIEDWKECTEELEKEGYHWNREAKRFQITEFK